MSDANECELEIVNTDIQSTSETEVWPNAIATLNKLEQIINASGAKVL
jgi:hypothetical protein